MDHKWLKEMLGRPGYSQAGLAAALGRNPSAINRMVRGERQIKASELPVIMKYLDEPSAADASVATPQPGARLAYDAAPRSNARFSQDTAPPLDAASARDAMPRPNARFAQNAAPPPYRSEMPKDVPVYGTVVGGDGNHLVDFELNGAVVDYVRRPQRLAARTDVFAAYVQGDSMIHWREPGQLVYVESARPPRVMDYVLVELKPPVGEGTRPAMIKRLLGVTPTKLRLRQYNPARDFDIDRRTVLRLYRVLDWDELLGV
jgi:phage repressor protein C with HTH and peptisase S24 domain